MTQSNTPRTIAMGMNPLLMFTGQQLRYAVLLVHEQKQFGLPAYFLLAVRKSLHL